MKVLVQWSIHLPGECVLEDLAYTLDSKALVSILFSFPCYNQHQIYGVQKHLQVFPRRLSKLFLWSAAIIELVQSNVAENCLCQIPCFLGLYCVTVENCKFLHMFFEVLLSFVMGYRMFLALGNTGHYI